MFRHLSFLCFCLVASIASAQDANTNYPAVDCVIQPYQVVDLGSPVSGVIEGIFVDRSDQVAVDQPVAKIEDSVEVATVNLAKARANIEAQVAIEKTNINYDERSQERIETLYGRKVIALDNKDEADREAELSRLRLEQVRDLQEVRNRELERAKELLEQKVIRSTIDGFVVERFKSTGEFVEDQPILRIAQLDPLNVEAILPMQYFKLIKPGMTAEVKPELPDMPVQTAIVSRVDRIGDTASGTFGVRLEMSNDYFQIPAGLKCDVKFLPTPDHALAEGVSQLYANINNMPAAVDPVPLALYQQQSEFRYILGPFDNESELRAAQQSIDGMDARIEEEKLSESPFFRVSSRTESLDQVMNSIADGTLKDYRRLTADGAYSLGAFSSRERANRWKDALAGMGISADVVDRSKGVTRWWIHVTTNEALAVQSLEEMGFKVQLLNTQDAGY